MERWSNGMFFSLHYSNAPIITLSPFSTKVQSREIGSHDTPLLIVRADETIQPFLGNTLHSGVIPDE
jgi:hypothetical protein